MKNYLIKLIALLLFVSAISSCSVEYRQRHAHYHDHDRGY
jgi:hypothetical protein